MWHAEDGWTGLDVVRITTTQARKIKQNYSQKVIGHNQATGNQQHAGDMGMTTDQWGMLKAVGPV
jgi:hypothetical protein